MPSATLRQYVLAVIVLIVAVPTLAYIPRGRAILQKTVKTHGEGVYQIDQDVQIQSDQETTTVRETWWVENPDRMRLKVVGLLPQRWELEILYLDKKRYVIETNGSIKSYSYSKEFVEPFFHYRSLSEMILPLIKMNVLPNMALQKPKPPVTLAQVSHTPEPFVRLGRVGGTIAYAFGEPSALQADFNSPGVWVEQDSFHLRKVRFKTQAEVNAEDYQIYDKNLHFPASRQISWNTRNASLKTTSVQALADSIESKFTFKDLENSSIRPNVKHGPQDPLLQEFYSRFR